MNARTLKLSAVVLAATLMLSATANADVYMQHPRGSNNTSSSSSASSTDGGFWEWISSFF